VTLLGASSKILSRIEIHQHSMPEGIMRMRQLDAIVIKAKQRIVLPSSGLHLMLFEIKAPYKYSKKLNLP